MTSILVIDASRTIRETLRIVLGHDYEVATTASAGDPPRSAAPALVILGLSSTDDEEPVRRLLAARSTVPVLFLHASDELDPALATGGGRRVRFLPKPFGSHALRTAVQALLAPATRTPAAAGSAYALEHPFLTHDGAATVRQALTLDLPLLFVGERGSGAVAVARAVHACRRPGGVLHALPAAAVDAARVHGLLAQPDAGLLLDEVPELPAETQHALALALDAGTVRGGLFATSSAPLDAAVARPALLPELAYPLGLLSVALPALRERGEDLPALIETLRKAIAARLGVAPLPLAPAAVERLCHYLWFGNVVELEAVLARTLAAARARVVGPEDLLFAPARAAIPLTAPAAPTAQPAPTTPDRPAPPTPQSQAGAARLEVLLGELAHELRNPMVTIKTFSQHLDSVLADPDARARFTALTTDAVARMDGLLEQLLEFARFRAPTRAPTDLGPLVDEALAEQRDELTRRHVRLERNGAAPGQVDADRAQVLFALRSLLGGLVHELVPHEPLKMTVPGSGAIEIEAHAEPATASRLTAFVDGADAEMDEAPTLPFALAAALLERNGGELRVRSGEAGATVIRVALAPVVT